MILFVAICLIAIGVLSALFALYNVYCMIGLVLFKRDVKKSHNKEVPKTQKFNMYLWVIKKLRGIKHAKDNKALKKAAKKYVAIALAISISITGDSAYNAFKFIPLGVVCLTLNDALTTVSSVLQTLFSKDEDCTCYALCTGEDTDDSKSTYEMLFGPTEYQKLVSDMQCGLTVEDIETDYPSGREKNNLIISYMNDDMVNDYKAIVGSNSSFRSDDGKDRSEMDFDQLKADLIALCNDYKVNGVNPDCNCHSYQKTQLKRKCMGEKHYVEGWSWSNLWSSDDDDSNDTSSDSDTGSNAPGNATGDYTIQLDDGTFYWYHQTAETSCKQNVNDANYGYTGSVLAGYSTNPVDSDGKEHDKSMSSRGCSVYSTAIALSNLLGEEITPCDVITKVLSADVKLNSTNNKYYFIESTGITFNDGSPCMDYNKLAERINAVYGEQGIVATVVSKSQENLDAYLYDDNSYAYAISSFENENGEDTNFTWYGHAKTGDSNNGQAHFIVVRAGSGPGKYKCFTSVRGKEKEGGHSTHSGIVSVMNDELSYSLVEKHERHGQFLILSRDKSYYKTASSGDLGDIDSSEIYKALSEDSDFKDKAKILTIVYNVTEPVYGSEFAIGLMANVWSEGSPGMVEEAFAWYHYWSFDSDSKIYGGTSFKMFTNAEQIDYVYNWDHTSKEKEPHWSTTKQKYVYYQKGSVGVGIVGWSFGRRVNVLKRYKEANIDFSKSKDELFEIYTEIEIKFMLEELASDDYYDKVVKDSLDQDCETAASNICLYYEAPNEKEKAAVTRAGVAKKIKGILSNIKTSTKDDDADDDADDSSDDSSSAVSASSSKSNKYGLSDGASFGVSGKTSKAKEDISKYYINNATTTPEKLVNYALKYVGCHYSWGGEQLGITGWRTNKDHLAAVELANKQKKDKEDCHAKNCPFEGVDCSGFVKVVFAKYGVSGIPHQSGDIREKLTQGVEVVDFSNLDNLKIGDIICYSGHVSIYIGNGNSVSASSRSDGIKISKNISYKNILKVIRIKQIWE
jgi:cell wall-associated NlpC family hydrolase